MKKRISALLIALSLTAGIIPSYALAAETSGEAVQPDDTLTVSDISTDADSADNSHMTQPGSNSDNVPSEPTGSHDELSPVMIDLKGSSEVRLGNNIYMHATIKGIDHIEGVTVNWYVNGKRIKDASLSDQTVKSGSKFDMTYQLPEDTTREQNKVTIKLSKEGCLTQSYSVDVETVFDFAGAKLSPSKLDSVAAGKTRRVKMTLSGMKKSIRGTAVWYVDGKKMNTIKDVKLSDGKTFTYSLTTKKTDAGTRKVQLVLSSADGKRTLKNTKEITIMGQYDKLISAYTTRFDSSQTGRSTNLRLAMNAINGTILKPGEVFSYNKAVGERTAARGFKMGYVYSGGQSVPGIGGGVCQVSSTLFNSVLLANLDIVERHYHSLTVSYVPLGRDATVLWNSKDFKFKNNYSYPIKLVTVYDPSGKLTIKVMSSPSVKIPKVTLQVTRSGGYTLKRYVNGKCNYTTYSTYG